jgi:phage terminase Nu1 subunit (DNA packaging protein)
MESEPKLVKTSDLCELLGVTRQAVYKWRKKGLPVVIKYKGGITRYHLEEVFQWLNDNRRKNGK